MSHVWRLKKWLPERHGQPCKVLARGNGKGPRNVLVEFEDGFRVVGTRFCVQKKPTKWDSKSVCKKTITMKSHEDWDNYPVLFIDDVPMKEGEWVEFDASSGEWKVKEKL